MMAQSDACLAKKVQETCPTMAKVALRTFLLAHNGVSNSTAFGIASLGCVLDALGIRQPKINEKAMLGCNSTIDANKVTDWFMTLERGNALFTEATATAHVCELTSVEITEQIKIHGGRADNHDIRRAIQIIENSE